MVNEKIVYRLHPSEFGTSGLFETRVGAEASARKQLANWLVGIVDDNWKLEDEEFYE